MARPNVENHPDPAAPHADAVLQAGRFTFVVEWKGSGAMAPVASAIHQVRSYASALGEHAIPLVAVPFMGPSGRKRCAEAGIGWLDLSGNARIIVPGAPGFRVQVEGQPNLYKRPGRPSSAFAPKSARIVRWLLMHPDQPLTQREIARATDMDEGFTSRIVARLEEDELIVRDPGDGIRVPDPDLLLDAWRDSYDFLKHRISQGHIPARSGEALLHHLVDTLRESRDVYAATGLAAAWLLDEFAGFRLVTLFVAALPGRQVLARLGFHEGSRGANVWLVVPNDEGVFHGASDQAGVHCVHPVQAYLDLKQQPERAKEAAQELRADLLTWSTDA